MTASGFPLVSSKRRKVVAASRITVASSAPSIRSAVPSGLTVPPAVLTCARTAKLSRPAIARRLIGHLLKRPAHQGALRNRLRLGVPPGKNQRTHVLEMRPRLWGHLRIRAARPKRFLVDLQPLAGHAAEDHGSEAAVT